MSALPLQPSVLRLDSYFVESLRFESQHEFDPDKGNCQPNPDDLRFTLDSAVTAEGQRAYRLTLILPPCEGRLPYSFEIVLVGVVGVEDSYPAEDAQKLADANAPTLLYGAARELLASVTGRGPFTALCLPSVTFHRLARKQNTAPELPAPTKKSQPKRKTTTKQA